MKQFLPFILILTFLAACYAPQRDCEKFRTGTFEFESYLNGELVTSTFVRNDSIEVDRFQGKTDSSSVRWINNCEYILTNLHPKNRAERQPIHIKILTTDNNSYSFEYGLVGDPQKKKGRVRKIN